MPVVSLAPLMLVLTASMQADGVLGIIALAWPGLTVIAFAARLAACAILSGATMTLGHYASTKEMVVG